MRLHQPIGLDVTSRPTCIQPIRLVDTSPLTISLQTACRRGTCYERNWWNSERGADSCPCRFPVCQGTQGHYHLTSDIDKIRPMTTILKHKVHRGIIIWHQISTKSVQWQPFWNIRYTGALSSDIRYRQNPSNDNHSETGFKLSLMKEWIAWFQLW